MGADSLEFRVSGKQILIPFARNATHDIDHGVLNWRGIDSKTKFLTQKLNFKSTVSVQRASYLHIPIEYTIRTKILSSFYSRYLKRSQIFENF